MNIKNRLKIIERKTIKANSALCLCYGVNLKYEVVPITIDEWKRRADNGKERDVKLPDFCDLCRKPVDKRFIETTFEEVQATIQNRREQVIETLSKFEDNEYEH